MRESITPLLIAYNEEPNIERTLEKLSWALRIVVVDSGSTDRTLAILEQYPQVDVIYRRFTNFAEQWNFGLAQVKSSWVLSLDADYEIDNDFMAEMFALTPPERVSGYAARFIYRIFGRALRGTLYPERTVLFRRDRAEFFMDGHTQRVVVEGEILTLKAPIYHDDRKPLSRWVASQQRYASDEAEHLLSAQREGLGRADKLRLMGWPAPIVVFFYVLFVKGCILDGWPGWFYALQRTIAEMLLALELTGRRLRRETYDLPATSL